MDDSDDYESRLVNLPMNPIDPVSLLPQGEGWKVDVPTLLGKAPQDYPGELIELPQLLSWHEKVTGLAINATGTHAAISYQSEDKHNRVPTRVVMADLRSGHVFANHKTGGALVVLALSDDASTLVMRSDGFGSGKKDRLELWNVTASAIQKGPAWIPYGDSNIWRDVQFASFAADGKLITSSAGGQVIAWTVSPLKAEWTCNAVEGCSPAMALGREHLLLAHNDQLCLLDLTRLQVIAAQPAPRGMHPKLSFSPQATRIGVGTLNANGVVYDTATGAKYREIERLSFFVPEAPIFVSEDQILITNMYLIDLPSQVPLWKYSFVHAKTQCGQAVWCVKQDGESKPGGLFSAKLPHPGVNGALNSALQDPSYFVLKPGSSVKLNLDSLPDQVKREEVRQSLTARLGKLKINVDPAAAVVIECRFDPPKERKITIFGILRKGDVDGTVNVNEIKSHIKISFEGQQLWEMMGDNRLPYNIERGPNESLQEAVRKYDGPNYGFFASCFLPGMLVHPSRGGSQTLGSSEVTTTGFE